MDNLKVGEYVRTKKGKIFKYGKGRAYLGKDNEIVNHSFNIIDLIEVGDIVFIEDFFGYNFIHVFDESMLEALKKDVKDGIKIKTILTHEQYERNCYRLENN